MAILPLIIAPDPRLKQLSAPILEVNSEIRKLFDDMLETMYHEHGAGIAAVQVGVLKRMLIVDISKEESVRNPVFMANPEITFSSEEKSTKNEGCLSFPDQRLEVERSAVVKVKFLDYHGKIQEIEVDDWLATAVQHEIDHLDGIVLPDRTSSKLKKDIMLRKALKIKKIILANK